MPLPSIETLCVHLNVTGQSLTITFPDGLMGSMDSC